MATSHNTDVNTPSGTRTIRGTETTVANGATAGDVSSPTTLVNGSVTLYAVRATHNDTVDRRIEIDVLDPDDTLYVTLVSGLVAPNVPVYWNGEMFLPRGWKIRAHFKGLAASIGGNKWTWYGTSGYVAPGYLT